MIDQQEIKLMKDAILDWMIPFVIQPIRIRERSAKSILVCADEYRHHRRSYFL